MINDHYVVNKIGRTVRIDHTTLEGSRGNFATICVEVDLSKPLLSKYRLRRRVRRIKHEGLHTICFNCGCYGHKDDTCKKIPEAVSIENQTTSFANPIFHEVLARRTVRKWRKISALGCRSRKTVGNRMPGRRRHPQWIDRRGDLKKEIAFRF
ncbi:hypothetical protein LINPERHAP2_LOCUS16875 [Linum perenne]